MTNDDRLETSGIGNIIGTFGKFNRSKLIDFTPTEKDFIMDKLKKVLRREKDEKTEEDGIIEVTSYFL